MTPDGVRIIAPEPLIRATRSRVAANPNSAAVEPDFPTPRRPRLCRSPTCIHYRQPPWQGTASPLTNAQETPALAPGFRPAPGPDGCPCGWHIACTIVPDAVAGGTKGECLVMHRQLKQTAFFVADTARKPYRHLGRHYHAPGRQRPLADVEGRVVVGWHSNAAADALELIPAWSVALINQAAARALAARVPGVYQIERDATHPRLVFDQGTKFVEAPIVQSSPLAPVGLDPITDAFEVFDGNRRPAAFGVENDCFAQHVVRVALEACLLAGSAPACRKRA